jgi:preprotein translocase subunit YajC
MLIIYVVAFIAIFYFMAIRPQQRQRRAHQALLSSLKKGDRIVTAAGIYGTVKRVEESIVVVEIAKGISIKIARRAVAEIVRDQAEARAAAPEALDRRGKGTPAEIEESTTTGDADAAAGEVVDDASTDEASGGSSEGNS